MPIHIGTCFRFYIQMLYIQALILDFIHKCGWEKKHLHIESIVTSHNSVLFAFIDQQGQNRYFTKAVEQLRAYCTKIYTVGHTHARHLSEIGKSPEIDMKCHICGALQVQQDFLLVINSLYLVVRQVELGNQNESCTNFSKAVEVLGTIQYPLFKFISTFEIKPYGLSSNVLFT